MSNFINIICVFDDENIKLNTTDKVKKIVQELNLEPICYKYCLDKDGNRWIESKKIELELKQIIDCVVHSFFGEITLKQTSKIKIKMSFEKLKDCNAIILSYSWSELEELGSVALIEKLLKQVLIRMYNLLNYDYAFCDSEVYLEICPKDFYKLEKSPYSITSYVNSGILKIVKQTWDVDGRTRI